MRIHRLAMIEASCVHSPVVVIALASVALGMALAGMGCERSHVMEDCAITVLVVDAGTEVPIDSAQVFQTSVDPGPYPYVGKRRFRGVTDESGRLFIFPTGCHGIHIVEVEKDGYQTARQTVQGAGVLYFRLQAVASNQAGSLATGGWRVCGDAEDGAAPVGSHCWP